MTMRYVQMYATGATGRLAEFAQKKYRGHRCLPETWYTELVDAYRAKYGQKAEFLEDMEALESRVEERDIFEEEEEEREEENPSAAEDPDAEWLAIEENDSEEEEQVQSRRSARNNFGCKDGKRTEFYEESDDIFDDELDDDQ